MNIVLQPKMIRDLLPTDILFQTAYWGRVKSRLGWQSVAFDFQSSAGQSGDVLVLIRPLNSGIAAAYVPQGPEAGPDPEKYGLFLEALSQAMMQHIESNIAFIRYDLPWEAPDAAEAAVGQPWSGYPTPRLRELRMNIGTRTWNLRKAVLDLTVADTLIVDLMKPEEDILKAMKPKTRYNIRLAQRKGVQVFNAAGEMLPRFYKLYLETAKRNGFIPAKYRHFSALFTTFVPHPDSSEIIFLLAAKGQDIIAGAIVGISGQRAIYLFGASSSERRNLMGPYAVHWEAIKQVRKRGCLSYDLGSVAPVADPAHPFYGMHRFKTGFGGKIVHRTGSWDYPLSMKEYKAFRNFESLSSLTLPDWRS
ncbi:MAG TPA: peptidoglycan bridge formation glycyltransferase FemA/FemB family protein [Smithellaceae bacterium]|nr:peptidoglycan bridge formation glycyltransferase FemA/FemB family protein [Smithellaceae bacterium]